MSFVSCVAVEKYVNYVVAFGLTVELYMKYSNVSAAVVELILGLSVVLGLAVIFFEIRFHAAFVGKVVKLNVG